AAAAAIYPKLPYDTLKDLAGITQTASSKYVLVVPPALGVNSVKDLLAAARARPGEINFSSAGTGSGTHLAAEILKAMAAIDVVHVPYKGIPEALSETLAGRVQFFMAPLGLEPRTTAPEEFDRLIARELALYTRIARAAKITSQ